MMVEAIMPSLDPRAPPQKMQAIQPMFPQMSAEAWCGEFLPKGTPPRHEVTAAVYEMAKTVLEQFAASAVKWGNVVNAGQDDGRQADPSKAG
jgi:hypothetical protein